MWLRVPLLALLLISSIGAVWALTRIGSPKIDYTWFKAMLVVLAVTAPVEAIHSFKLRRLFP